MVEYVNTNPGDTIGLHDVLRVTFAETPSFLVPDDIATANLASDVDRLIASMAGGGYALAPVSDPTVAPGSQAVTIDFMPPSGAVSVATALEQLQRGLFGVLEFIHSTAVARVEKITGAQAGASGAGVARGAVSQTMEQQLAQTAFGSQLASIFGKATTGLLLIAVVVGIFVFAPQIKAVLRRGER